MWVFGYGSLMWDDWEKQYDGSRTEGVRLAGYSRQFNKGSSRRWGTTLLPCPTLSLEPRTGSECIGCAFEFPSERRDEVTEYLQQREGPSMELREVSVNIPAIGNVKAVTALLRPATAGFLRAKTPREVAEMVQRTSGATGSCFEYFVELRGKLRALGVVDPAVESIAQLVCADPGQLPLIPAAVLQEHPFFYHAATEDRWAKIKEEGLRPEYATQVGYALTALAKAGFVCLTTADYLTQTIEMILEKNDSKPVVVLRIRGVTLSTKRCTLDYTASWVAPLLARGVPNRDLLTEARYLACLDPITPVEFAAAGQR